MNSKMLALGVGMASIFGTAAIIGLAIAIKAVIK